MITRDSRHGKRAAIEWIIGGLSGIAVLAIVSFLAAQAIVSASGGPVLSVSIVDIEATAQGSIVTIRISNTGTQAASDIWVSARDRGQSGQPVRLQFGYLGSDAEQHGAFLLAGPVEADKLQLRVDGWLEP